MRTKTRGDRIAQFAMVTKTGKLRRDWSQSARTDERKSDEGRWLTLDTFAMTHTAKTIG